MSVVVPLPVDRPPDPRPPRVSLRRIARFLAAISGLCGAAAFPASSVFDLHAITVTGNAAVPASAVLRLADLRPGLNAFQVNAGTIRERLLTDARIENVTVTMEFPSRVRLVVRERAPIAALASGGSYIMLSADGVAISTDADRGPLPVLIVDRLGPTGVSIGQVVQSPDLRLGARVAGTVPEPLRDRITAVRVNGAGEVELALRDGTSVRLGGTKGMDERVEMIPQVLDAIATRGLQVESVDLRFPGSIVVQPVQAAGAAAPARPWQENPPMRGIRPAMHRPSIP
jgi:cell division septal protein FtsQ